MHSMHYDTPPHRKLQQFIIHYFETISQSGCWSSWEQLQFFLNTYLHLRHLQVTIKAK